MDLAYWGFSHWPFMRRQSPDGPIAGASQEEAFARLLFLVDERRRFGFLTGSTGTGKTCLLRRLAMYAERHGSACLKIDATGSDAGDLTWQIADQLSADCSNNPSLSRCWQQIQRQLINRAIIGQSVVAIIDNLDLANHNAPEAIRRLMNLADSQGADLTVLIAACRWTSLRDLASEIEMSIELSAWTRQETADFIQQSLRTAGSRSSIFSSDAIFALHEMTQGNPRSVIQACDLALLAAMSDGLSEVSATVIESAAIELSAHQFSAEFDRAI